METPTTANVADVDSSNQLDPKRWTALLVVLSAAFMELVDISIVNIAIPAIQTDLGASYAAVQWVVAGYALSFALLLITGGRLGDIYGRKRMFLAGMAGFTIASVLCGAAQTSAMLVGGRILQGVGAALMMPQVLSTIQVVFPPRERTKAFGAYGAVAGIATVSGPLIGALIIEANILDLSWRPIFLVNVVVGVVAFVMAVKVLPESKSPAALRLDIPGVFIVTIGLFALFFPLIQGRELDWPAWTFVSMALSPVILAVFVVYERYKTRLDGSPLVVLELFRERTFVAGALVSCFFLAGIGSFFLVFTIALQAGFGYAVLATGLTGLPFSIGAGIGSGVSGKVAPRIGRPLLTAGCLLLALGMFSMSVLVSRYGADIHPWQFIASMLISGIGLGCVIVPMLDFVLAKVEPKNAGSASGLANTLQQVGSAAGIAIVGVIFFGLLGSHSVQSAERAAPALQEALSVSGLPPVAQTTVVQGFVRCFEDRSNEKDPATVPASCPQNGSSGSPAIGSAFTQAANTALGDNFAHAFQRSLWYETALFLLVAALTTLLPRKAEHHEDLIH